MWKIIISLLFLQTSINALSQQYGVWETLNGLEAGYRIDLMAGANFMAAPTYLNFWTENEDDIGGVAVGNIEDHSALTLGVVGRIEFSPLVLKYGDYTYFTEVSPGILIHSTHFYKYRGHIFRAGYGKVFGELEFSRRQLRLSHDNAIHTVKLLDSEVYDSDYNGIRRSSFGLQWRLEEDKRMSAGVFFEKFNGETDREAWQGVYFKWLPDRAFGAQVEASWNHANDGSLSPLIENIEELPQSGFYCNVKLTYQLNIKNTYFGALAKLKELEAYE